MSAHPTDAAAPDDPGQPAAPAYPHRQALDDLITMGTDLARALHRQALIQAEAAQAAVPPRPMPHAPHEPPATALVILTTAFDRIARAVRRCIALAQRLDTPPAPARDPAHHRAAARKQVIRAVEDTIHRAANEGDRAESLNAELRDRLDTPDLDWDLATRPIPDIIAEITRDLGLATPPGGARPWPRRTPADLQDMHARAAAPSRAAAGHQHEAPPAGHVGPYTEDPHVTGPHTKGPHTKGPHTKGPHTKGPHTKGNASGESPGASGADRRRTQPSHAATGFQPGPTGGSTQRAPQRPPSQQSPTSPWHAESVQITPAAASRQSPVASGPQAPVAHPTPVILLHPTRLRGHWRPPPGT